MIRNGIRVGGRERQEIRDTRRASIQIHHFCFSQYYYIYSFTIGLPFHLSIYLSNTFFGGYIDH